MNQDREIYGEIEYRKYVEGRVTTRFRVAAERAAAIDEMLVQSADVSTAHGNAEPVIIWGEVNQEVYDKAIAERGAKPITDRVFPSAIAASRQLGYGCNAVAQELATARARGQDVAVLRGVPLRWAEDVPAID
jgi:hypothetical protein